MNNALHINFSVNRYGIVQCKISLTETDKSTFSTGVQLAKNCEWDKARQRIKPYEDPQNQRLDNVQAALRKIQNRFDLESRPYSTKSILNIYKNPPQVQTFLKMCQELVKQKISVEAVPVQSVKTYNKYLNKVSAWLKHDRLENLLINDFDEHHADSFRAYCRLKHGNKNTTINKNMELVKGAIHSAIKRKIITSNPLYQYKSLKEPKPDITCISDQELHAIKALQNLCEMHQKARDIFLFLSGGGMHIGDYLNLEKIGNLKTDQDGYTWLHYTRGKTQTAVVVPLSEFPESMAVLGRYGNRLDSLPKMAQQTFNRQLKDLGRMVGTDKNLTSKVVGRKKFTDTALNQKALPKDLVITMLGHTSDKNIKHYGERSTDGIKRILEQIKSTNIER